MYISTHTNVAGERGKAGVRVLDDQAIDEVTVEMSAQTEH